MVFQDYCTMMILERTETEKFTTVLSCNYWQHWWYSSCSGKIVGNLIAEAEV